MSEVIPNFNESRDVINKSQTVLTSLIEVAVIPVLKSETLGCEIAVTSAALTQFAIQGRFTGAASYQTLFNTAGDFTSPTGLIVGASGDLTTQAIGSGWFIMDCDGLESVRIQAASGTSSGVQVLGSAK